MLNAETRPRNSLIDNLGMTVRFARHDALSKEYQDAWLDLYGSPGKAKAQYYKMHVRPVKYPDAYQVALERYNKAKHQVMLCELYGLDRQILTTQTMENFVSGMGYLQQVIGRTMMPAMLRYGETLMNGFQTGIVEDESYAE